MTVNDRLQLIDLAAKDLKEAVRTYLIKSREGYQDVPKSCLPTAIKRRITQLRIDLKELEKEIDEE